MVEGVREEEEGGERREGRNKGTKRRENEKF